jgi:hypothetical protein
MAAAKSEYRCLLGCDAVFGRLCARTGLQIWTFRVAASFHVLRNDAQNVRTVRFEFLTVPVNVR